MLKAQRRGCGCTHRRWQRAARTLSTPLATHSAALHPASAAPSSPLPLSGRRRCSGSTVGGSSGRSLVARKGLHQRHQQPLTPVPGALGASIGGVSGIVSRGTAAQSAGEWRLPQLGAFTPGGLTAKRGGSLITSVQLTTAGAWDTPREEGDQGAGRRWALGLAAALCLAMIAVASTVDIPGRAVGVKDYLFNGALTKSHSLAAFLLIFFMEIGDKTFFIAALLAMRVGKLLSFSGSLLALTVMTGISVGIGAVFAHVPDAFRSSVPVGEIAGIALLVVFGIKALREAAKAKSAARDDELADAESAVKTAEERVVRRSTWSSLVEVGTLIFLAEWGDRSMLATIALAASYNPYAVAVGATMGHAMATAIAVVGGALAANYVSERTINLVSGGLFLFFAAATAIQML